MRWAANSKSSEFAMAVAVAGIIAWSVAAFQADSAPVGDQGRMSSGTAPEAAPKPGLWSNIGHRGVTGSLQATENTLRAFAIARDGGATAVEFDVRVTADGQLLVMHDASLARTTNCAGSVSELAWADIRARCRGNVAGEQIPSLSRALAWVKRHGLGALVELKPPTPNLTTAVLADIIARIHEAELSGRALVFSRGLSLLGQVESLDPMIRTHYIAGTYADVVRSFRLVDGVNVCAELLHDRPGLAQELTERDMLVMGRVSNGPAEWSALFGHGAHGTLTDDPAALTDWLDGNPDPSPTAPDGDCRTLR